MYLRFHPKYPRSSAFICGFNFGGFAFVQEGDGYFVVEEVNEGAHEKGGYDCTDAGDGWDFFEFMTGYYEDYTAGYNADKVGADADVFELPQVPLFCHGDGNCIVGGNSKVCGHVKG